jgi:hypothetical protein
MDKKIMKRGRPVLPEHEKRQPCHNIRLQAIWLFWLSKHKGVGGRMIEEALDSYFAPNKKRMIAEFYGRK